jgi:lipid-binding SYLF domain-containing protein
LATILGGCATTPPNNQDLLKKAAQDTVAEFCALNTNINEFVKTSAGYAVFPRIGKGAAGLGVAYGRGVVYERGQVAGWCNVRQGSIGLQLGGQTYSQIIFFQEDRTLANFKVGKLELSANASAIIVQQGAAASSDYEHGVAIFIEPQNGLMAEVAVGGQKFSYEPISQQ